MQEKWKLWQPISTPPEHYNLESCSTNDDYGLQIILIGDLDKRISITLPGYIGSYRITKETFITDTLIFLENNYDKKFYTQNTFFTIENSEYLEWMKKQVDPIAFEYYKFKHFCILTSDALIDIISDYEPTVKHID